MADISVKNIPDELYKMFKAYAKAHHRSVNNQIIALMEEKMKPQTKLTREEVIARARHLRAKVSPQMQLTEELLRKLKNEGRE